MRSADVEGVFAAFVRNSNSTPPPAPAPEPVTDADIRIAEHVSDTENTKRVTAPAPDEPPGAVGSDRGAGQLEEELELELEDLEEHHWDASADAAALQEEEAEDASDPDSSDVMPLTRKKPGIHTQRVEAARVVPDVASVAPPPPPVPERSIDGQMPAGLLDRVLGDLAVLLRWGHQGQVTQALDELLQNYPEDLLLLRRIAEFHIETGDFERAKVRLFKLASGLFERRNVEGMRRALEQVLVIEPNNDRALRLLGLLDRRDGSLG